jgi:hypothetical protein
VCHLLRAVNPQRVWSFRRGNQPNANSPLSMVSVPGIHILQCYGTDNALAEKWKESLPPEGLSLHKGLRVQSSPGSHLPAIQRYINLTCGCDGSKLRILCAASPIPFWLDCAEPCYESDEESTIHRVPASWPACPLLQADPLAQNLVVHRH